MTVPQNALCNRCRALDLESYVNAPSEQGRGTIAFVEKTSLWKTCELCIQFGHILKAFKTAHATVSNQDSFSLDFRDVNHGRTRLVFFRVRFMEFTRVLDFDFDFYPTAAVFPEASPLASAPLCRQMTAASADLNLAKQWLHSCKTSHAECASSAIWNESLRVLDCGKHMLTSIGSSEQYACLSYVWGNRLAVKEPLDSAGDLQRMPQTIINAMSVCMAIGIPYLWVDRYCIDQNNPVEKHHIISNMDAIYQGAHLTIIATAGQDPSHGLPGVQNTPRRRQLYLQAGPHTFASTQNIRDQINASNWNSRGWTYQEGLLSRRRLVFTDSQMYFQCQRTHYLESFNMAATDSDTALRDRFRVFPPLDVTSLQDRLAEYYQRHLSVKSDVIHAFSGVCNHALALRDTTTPPVTFSHFYGVPIHYAEAQERDVVHVNAFVRDLAWIVMHRNVVSESPEFPLTIPTWSWASPKARHQSSQFSGEYWQPPLLLASEPELRPRCITKSGAIVDIEHLSRQGIDYSKYCPQLLFQGILLEGSFTSARSSLGTAYFDSLEALDSGTTVAMYLGLVGDVLNEDRDSWFLEVSETRTYRMICLLLQPLTSEQRSTLQSGPRFEGSSYYRRVGLWSRRVVIDDAKSELTSAEMMEMTFKQLKLASPQVGWAWRRQALTLV